MAEIIAVVAPLYLRHARWKLVSKRLIERPINPGICRPPANPARLHSERIDIMERVEPFHFPDARELRQRVEPRDGTVAVRVSRHSVRLLSRSRARTARRGQPVPTAARTTRRR